jgi:hypothetical protein
LSTGQISGATHSFSNRAGFGTHPSTLTNSGGVIRVDISSITGATVYRAVINPRRVYTAGANFPRDAFSFSDLIINDASGNQLNVLAPRFLSLDATQAVQNALSQGLSTLVLTIINDPGGSLFYNNPVLTLEVMCDVPLPAPITQVSNTIARFKDGDTMISFNEVNSPLTNENTTCGQYNSAIDTLDLVQEVRYRIYRSTVPVSAAADVVHLEYVDEIKPLSCWNAQYYGMYNCNGTMIVPRYPLDDLVIADPGTGIYVNRFKGTGQQTAYYYVSRAVNGAEDFSVISVNGNASQSVTESPGYGMVVLREVQTPESFQYVDNPTLNYYVRWECPPTANVPSKPYDYLVAESPASKNKEHPAVNLALHCWGGSLNGGYGWWYRSEEGAIMVSSNQYPYDWWTAYNENLGTIKSLTGSTVKPFNQVRLLSFLYDFAIPEFNADPSRITLSGTSMGGSGASMWGIRSGHIFSNIISWVGVHIAEESPTFTGSYLGVYGGDRSRNCVYSNEGLARFGYETILKEDNVSPWDYWDNEHWLNAHRGVAIPWISYANGRNDNSIGWEQAYKNTLALMDTKRPFNFHWGMGGHSERALLLGTADDRYCSLDFRKNQFMPAFSNCSHDTDLGASAGASPETGLINQYFMWNTATIEDSIHHIAFNTWLINSAPSDSCTTNISFWRVQNMLIKPGYRYNWESLNVSTGAVVQSGNAVADSMGLITIEGVRVRKGSNSRRIILTLDPSSVPNINILPGTTVEVGENVYFDAKYYSNLYGHEIQCEWDFGDGYVLYADSDGNPFETGLCGTHYFMSPGEYKIRLTVSTFNMATSPPTRESVLAEDSITITVTGEAPLANFELLHAPFHARTAQYLYAKVPEAYTPSQVLLRVQQTGGGYSQILSGTTEGEMQKFLLNNASLPIGDFVIIAELKSGETIVSTIREKFSKTYEGAPTVGIDENNSFILNGTTPFLPVGPYMMNTGPFPLWSKVSNTLHTEGWYESHHATTWVDYIEKGNDENMMTVGPGRWAGFLGSPYSRNSNPDSLIDYIAQAKNSAGLLGWCWDDEPNMGGRYSRVPATVLSGWNYLTNQADPQHPSSQQYYGFDWMSHYNPLTGTHPYSFMRNASSFGGKKTFIADFFTHDAYPMEYKEHVSLNYPDRGIIDLWLENLDNFNWNMAGLVPLGTFIEPQNIETFDRMSGTSYLTNWDAGPTPGDVRTQAWGALIHGMKYIGYFQYFASTPADNLSALAELKEATTALTPIILSAPSSKVVTHNCNERGNRVDLTVRETETDVYVIAARISEPESEWSEVYEPETISFELNTGIESSTAYNELEKYSWKSMKIAATQGQTSFVFTVPEGSIEPGHFIVSAVKNAVSASYPDSLYDRWTGKGYPTTLDKQANLKYGFDDGSGNVISLYNWPEENISGTINYTTGQVHLNFMTGIPAGNEHVQIAYAAANREAREITMTGGVLNDELERNAVRIYRIHKIEKTNKLENRVLIHGSIECFDALDTILVAGNGTSVTFESGSSIDLIAGKSIRFLPGFHAHEGNTTHAWISTNGEFCFPSGASVVSNSPINKSEFIVNEEYVSHNNAIEKQLKVFPNPNNGRFTIKVEGLDQASQLVIYNLLGAIVHQDIIHSQQSIDISDKQPGLYLVKISNSKKALIQKILIK